MATGFARATTASISTRRTSSISCRTMPMKHSKRRWGLECSGAADVEVVAADREDRVVLAAQAALRAAPAVRVVLLQAVRVDRAVVPVAREALQADRVVLAVLDLADLLA